MDAKLHDACIPLLTVLLLFCPRRSEHVSKPKAALPTAVSSTVDLRFRSYLLDRRMAVTLGWPV